MSVGQVRMRPLSRSKVAELTDKMAEMISVQDFRGIMKKEEEVLALAGELSRSADAGMAARTYGILGHSFSECCDHAKGLGLLEQAKAMAMEAGDRSVLCSVCHWLEACHKRQGEHEKAISEHEQAIAIELELELELGDRQAGTGAECSKLWKLLDESVQLPKGAAAPLTDGQVRLYKKIGELYVVGADFELQSLADSGLELAEELLRFHQHRFTDCAATIYQRLGHSFSESDDYVKALKFLERARALSLETGNKELLLDACYSLGVWHRRQGQFPIAIERLEQANSISLTLGDRIREQAVLGSLGNTYACMHQTDKAIRQFERCLKLQKEAGESLSAQAATRYNLGIGLSHSGQHERAVACLKQAWAVFEESGDVIFQSRLALALGETLWAKALSEHHQAAAIEKISVAAAACTETLQDAEMWLSKALDLAHHFALYHFARDAQMHLACLTFLKGDKDKAVQLLSQHLLGWMALGRMVCAGCFQNRREDAPMLKCQGCGVARSAPVLLRLSWPA